MATAEQRAQSANQHTRQNTRQTARPTSKLAPDRANSTANTSAGASVLALLPSGTAMAVPSGTRCGRRRSEWRRWHAQQSAARPPGEKVLSRACENFAAKFSVFAGYD